MKKLILGVLLVSSSLSVAADENHWVWGLGYLNLSDEVEEGIDVSLGGITGSLGYKMESGENFYVVPEVRMGMGISDDSVSYLGANVDIELNRFVALSVRAQFELDSGVYFFAAPAYANAKLEALVQSGGQSASITEDSWEFGLGVGLGYSFNNSTSIDFMYEQHDGTDAIGLGLKFDM